MKTKVGILLAVGVATLAACTPQSRQEYSQAGNEAAQAMKRDADSAARASQAAATAAKQSLHESSAHATNNPPSGPASKAIDNLPYAVQTPKVKAALLEAKGLDTSHINVNTVGHLVTLEGSVPSAQQKAQAEQIAKKACGTQFTVVDQLKTTG